MSDLDDEYDLDVDDNTVTLLSNQIVVDKHDYAALKEANDDLRQQNRELQEQLNKAQQSERADDTQIQFLELQSNQLRTQIRKTQEVNEDLQKFKVILQYVIVSHFVKKYRYTRRLRKLNQVLKNIISAIDARYKSKLDDFTAEPHSREDEIKLWLQNSRHNLFHVPTQLDMIEEVTDLLSVVYKDILSNEKKSRWLAERFFNEGLEAKASLKEQVNVTKQERKASQQAQSDLREANAEIAHLQEQLQELKDKAKKDHTHAKPLKNQPYATAVHNADRSGSPKKGQSEANHRLHTTSPRKRRTDKQNAADAEAAAAEEKGDKTSKRISPYEQPLVRHKKRGAAVVKKKKKKAAPAAAAKDTEDDELKTVEKKEQSSGKKEQPSGEDSEKEEEKTTEEPQVAE